MLTYCQRAWALRQRLRSRRVALIAELLIAAAVVLTAHHWQWGHSQRNVPAGRHASTPGTNGMAGQLVALPSGAAALPTCPWIQGEE